MRNSSLLSNMRRLNNTGEKQGLKLTEEVAEVRVFYIFLVIGAVVVARQRCDLCSTSLCYTYEHFSSHYYILS